ncbi:unnamed protein product [Adineta steineri]|nr:unnamed protein product [Adineta steineri]
MEVSTAIEEQDTCLILSEADVRHTDVCGPVTAIDITGDICGSSLNCGDFSVISVLRSLAYRFGGPLKFICDVASNQRLQYPDEKSLVAIQTIKGGDNKKTRQHPVLQIPIEYVKVIEDGGPVDLISAIASQGNNHDHVSDFYLAPYRGFWPFGKKNRPSRDKPFSNPMIQPITREQIKMVKTAEGEISYQIKLSLCLMHAVNARYSTNTQAPVKFDQDFILSNAQPVVSHHSYSLPSSTTDTGTSETINGKHYSVICALRGDPKASCIDGNTICSSAMFTIEPRVRRN